MYVGEGWCGCVCIGVCVHVLLAQRFLMSRMMPKICIRVQVNNDNIVEDIAAMLLPISSISVSESMNSYFTSKHKTLAHCKPERKYLMMSYAMQIWMKGYIFDIGYKLARSKMIM